MALAVVIILLVAGSLIFHFLSPWWFTPIASNWGMIDTTVDITFWVTGAVFVAVNLFLAYCVIRYRHRKGHKADYDPENKKLEGWLTVITAVGVAAMLAPGLIVWGQVVTVPANAKTVEIVGQQWHWNYRFPGEDGVLGQVDTRLITPDNPYGMDPDDPRGRDDILIASPELHLPVGQPIKAMLRSKDVLHDFAVPEFRVKMDLVPGMVTYVWFEPTREGKFDLLCQELCGISHHAMRGRVIVENQGDFETWLSGYPTWDEIASMPPPDINAGKAQYASCAACHGFEGQGNQDLHAPKLAGHDQWYIVRQINNYKQGLRGRHEGDTWGQQMAAMAGTLPTEDAVRNVAAYIETLPDKRPVATIDGDADRGKAIYATCASCHGKNGQGIWALNAPRQAGMSDWYLAAQLEAFRKGWRGTHPDDIYGSQMQRMAVTLADDSINDLIAYINTLSRPDESGRMAMTNLNE